VQPADTKPIRVLLVDDHQLLTDALSRMLEREEGIRVVGVAGTVEDAKQLARERLDVVLAPDPTATARLATLHGSARWTTALAEILRNG